MTEYKKSKPTMFTEHEVEKQLAFAIFQIRELIESDSKLVSFHAEAAMNFIRLAWDLCPEDIK